MAKALFYKVFSQRQNHYPLEIAVNTRLLQKNKLEGIGRFMFETLKRITVNHPEHHFYFIFDREYDDEFLFSDNITPVIIGPKARHPLLFVYWLEESVYKILDGLKIDLFISCDGYLSLRSNVKQVAVIHDINFFHHPKDLGWLVSKYYNYFFPRFAKKASQIATVSQFSKNDIIKSYGIEETKIDVVYNGCSEGFEVLSQDAATQVKANYTGEKEYFLYVGSLQPRKNLARLFTAFNQFKIETKSDIKLVIAGSKYLWTKAMQQSLNNCEYKLDIIFLDSVSENNLHQLYGAAFALIYIPIYEGFGIPLLEAMNSEIPILTANVSSLPEVAQDAALYCNPYDIADITNKIKQLYSDDLLRKQLVAKGNLRKENFSWDSTANALWKSCEKVLHKKRLC